MLGFNKQPAPSKLDAPNTIIGKGTLIEADLLSGGESVRIDGEYRGNIDIDGSLVVGDTGIISGDVYAKYIIVAGHINGNIKCETTLHFASSAKVNGDIETNALIVDEGSQINGRYSVGEIPVSSRRYPGQAYENQYQEPQEEYYDDAPVRVQQSGTDEEMED
jgi:cytoskeletal protein CcmA (bactofilin family)